MPPKKESKFMDVLSCLGFYLIDFLKNQCYFDINYNGITKHITFNYLPFVNKRIMNLLLKTYFERNEFPSYSVVNYSPEKQIYIKNINFVMINEDIEESIILPQHIVSLTIGQVFMDFDYRFSKNFETEKKIYITSDLIPKNLKELNFSDFSYTSICLTDDCLKNLSRLKKIRLPRYFNQAITKKFFPNSLTDLDLGYCFNHPLPPGSFPDNLINLTMQYNDALTKEFFPNQLTNLTLFRQKKCDPGIFPESLRRLTLYCYNHNLEQNFFPSSLKKLFLVALDSKIETGGLPKNLIYLEMTSFKQMLCPNILPKSLIVLNLHHYNHPLEPGILPSSLLKLKLGFYDQPLEPGVLPDGLLSLKFLYGFNQELKPNVLPQKLKTLFFGDKFNHQIDSDGVLPRSLQRLQFGESFDQPLYFLDKDTLPNLSSLYLWYRYEHHINFDKLQNLSMIVFQKPSYLTIEKEMITCIESLDSEYEWEIYKCLYGDLMWKRKKISTQ